MSLYQKPTTRLNSSMFKKNFTNAVNSAKMFKKNTPNTDLNLHDVLKNSYASPDKQANFGKDKGYIYDKDLSNHNQQVYFHPDQKKLLVSIAGTHNASDLVTDARMMAGGLKNTDRFKSAQSTLNTAKNKYGVDSATIAGHSLGGVIGSYAGSSKDKV